MKTNKGAYRFVIFTKTKVYKFATFHYVWGVLKNIPRMIKNGDSKFIIKELLWGFRGFGRGIAENKSEFSCWKRTRSPLLVPTYFGCGIVNVQKRQYGTTPTHEELQKLFAKLPPQTQFDLHLVESHCLEPGNFMQTKDGMVFVDYDDGTSPTAKQHPFTVFIEKWHRELKNTFIPRIS